MRKIGKSMFSGAMAFILLMGVVSLFSDMTHEGARSILGEYLDLVGASAGAIGFVSGAGELCGYSLRLFAGMLADKTKKYWSLIILGYALQVLAVPALALVPENGWKWACGLVILERIGKAIKKPAKNTLISFAAEEVGTGKGFAFQEFLDQLGAFAGPVMLFLIGIIRGGGTLLSTYRLCFAALGIPAAVTIFLVLCSALKYPNPEMFEREAEETEEFRFQKSFLLYMAAICMFAFGFADFTLITLHAARTRIFPEEALSLLYALAMAVDAFAALFFGWLFDRIGLRALMLSTACSAGFSALIFLGGNHAGLFCLGIALWGIGMGAQESIMKAAVSKIAPRAARGTSFGIFETGFGIAWFLGSWLLGCLYDLSPLYPALVSSAAQCMAIVFYALCIRAGRREDMLTKSP